MKVVLKTLFLQIQNLTSFIFHLTKYFSEKEDAYLCFLCKEYNFPINDKRRTHRQSKIHISTHTLLCIYRPSHRAPHRRPCAGTHTPALLPPALLLRQLPRKPCAPWTEALACPFVKKVNLDHEDYIVYHINI